ncbi:hypothetical protein EJB05_17823, partial [Eragrostis curvula]
MSGRRHTAENTHHATPCRTDGAASVAPARAGQRSSLWTTISPARGVGFIVVSLVLLALVVGLRRWSDLDASSFLQTSMRSNATGQRRSHDRNSTAPLVPIHFSCSKETSPQALTCPGPPSPPPRTSPRPSGDSAPLCPDYFRFIQDDLRPWHDAGITREAVERGLPHAYFRLVVLAGRAYVKTYRPADMTRDVFTQWGVLQLLRRYAGRVPDLDVMFSCDDLGQVRATDYRVPSEAPPVFRYCKETRSALDIVFPDWSFWGWPEYNIRPWPQMLEEVTQENERVRWPERQPYAYWKGKVGKPHMGHMYRIRHQLMRCNISNGHEWNARLFRQVCFEKRSKCHRIFLFTKADWAWSYAIRNGFKDSSIPKQCLYRYKIYIEGNSWSPSEKYIFACNSTVLFVETPFQDILSRALVADKHYLHINRDDMCRSIKTAVDRGNQHPEQAQLIGEQGSKFVREEMSMDHLYDYMLHLLTEYAKLLRYKPTVPNDAVEICSESMACAASGRERDYMIESMERYVTGFDPCTLPPRHPGMNN